MARPNENPFEIVDPRFQRYTLPIVWLEQLPTCDGLRVRRISPICDA